MAPQVKHSVYLFDEHPVVIQGLERMLAPIGDLEIIGSTQDENLACEQVAKLKPRMAVVEIAFREHGGVDIIKRLKAAYPDLHVLVFSVHDENVMAERCLRLGAMGYVMKRESPQRVLQAVRQVAQGGFFFSSTLLSNIVSGGAAAQRAGNSARGEPGRLLSDRQLEIFEMVGRGLDSHEIATKLNLSSKTVDAHKANIRQKLGLGSARELLMEAVRWIER